MSDDVGEDFQKFDPDNSNQLKLLATSANKSFKDLEAYRLNRINFIENYVGSHFYKSSRKKIPVNMMELAIGIYMRKMITKNPQVLVDTPYRKNPDLRPQALTLQIATNYLLNDKLDIVKDLRPCILDALFSVGICKMSLKKHSAVDIEGNPHDYGYPYVSHISLDDFIIDMNAKRLSEIAYVGNKSRVPLEYILDNPDFFDGSAYNYFIKKPSQDESKDKTAHNIGISKGYSDDDCSFKKYVDICELYLPYENLYIILPYGDGGIQFDKGYLRANYFDGPASNPLGMYYILGYGQVPDNIMPLSPASLWLDLHELSNILFRKLGRQAERQKTNLLVDQTAVEDGKRIIDAVDGEAIVTKNPDRCREVRYGGIDNSNFMFLTNLKDLYSYFAGNLDTLGGLSPQADTLGQDKLLAESASERVQAMRDMTLEFVNNICRDLAWYLWTDPIIELPLYKRIKGTDIEIPVSFTPEDREGDFFKYNFKINPYSMQDDTPATKMNKFNNIWQTYILPMLPMLQQAGSIPNFEEILSFIAQNYNMPELENFIMMVDSQTQNMTRNGVQPTGTPPSKSPITKRTYERVNRQGATSSSKNGALMMALSKSNVNGGQANKIFNPVS